MADSKLTALTADTNPGSDSIVYSVDDPGGTPASVQVTAANLITKAHGLSDGIVKVASSVMTPATAGTDYYAPSGTDVAVADGGTGASTAGTARTNLGIDDIATKTSKLNATAPPTANDDSANTSGNGTFAIGSIWIDTTNDKTYVCVDATATAAVWNDLVNASGLGNIVEDTTPQLGGTLDGNGNDISLDDTNALNFGTGIELKTDSANIGNDYLYIGGADAIRGIVAPNELQTYANVGLTGAGSWEPYFNLKADGRVAIGNTSQGINKYLEVVMPDGIKLYTVSPYTSSADILADNLTADRTFQFPNATGNLVVDTATQTLTNKTLTSPTLTTPALGTPASGVLTNTTGYPGDSSLTTVGTVTTGNVDAVVSASSTTTAGKVELATIAETSTGTDTSRAVTPDGLAGSVFGRKGVQIMVFAPTTDVATGDGAGYFHIDSSLAGMNIVDVHAEVITAGTTGTTDIQIHNVTSAADVLSTKLTIDSAETGSDTAATAAVINAAEDDVAENDLLRIDVDAVSTTAPKGLLITIGFRLP